MQETIAIVFDFDDTLAPDTTSGFLDWIGIGDVEAFWADEVAPLVRDGWDPVPAYMLSLIHI